MAISKTATKAPASAKKAAPKKAATSTAKKVAIKKVAAKKPTAKKVSTPKSGSVSGFERYKMIEVAAYYMAEKKGFAGNSTDYWVAAEKEINKKLAKK
jgi:Protein of unknown function (DUF2934)